ncbi:MAG: hypothetical protein LQ351_000612 [Letrouitia transgressa]|nr:MAG: hypothetical protein LQ351_000612 [Letrouitia transgressa]
MSKRMTPTSTTYYTWSPTNTTHLVKNHMPTERSAVQEQNRIRIESNPIHRMRVSEGSARRTSHNSFSPGPQNVSNCVKEPPQERTKRHPSGSGSREQAVQTENIVIIESKMDNFMDQVQEADAAELETSKRLTPTIDERNPINSLLDTFSRLRENKMMGSVPVRQHCRQGHQISKSLTSEDTPFKTLPQTRGSVAESLHQLAPWMERKSQRSTGPADFNSLPQESNMSAAVAPFSFPQPSPRYLKQQQTSTQRGRQCFGFANPNSLSTQYPVSYHTQVGCGNLFERQRNQGVMTLPSRNINSAGGDPFLAIGDLKDFDIGIDGSDFVDHDKAHDQIDDENRFGSELLEVQYEADDYADHDPSSELQFHENPWHLAIHRPNDGQELKPRSEHEGCSVHRKSHNERFHMDHHTGQTLPSPSNTDRSKPLDGFLGQCRLPHLSAESPPLPVSAMSRPWTRESDHRIREPGSLRDRQVSEDKSLTGFWKPNRLY